MIELTLLVQECSHGWLARVVRANVPIAELPDDYASCFALTPYRDVSINQLSDELRNKGFRGSIVY